MGFEPMCLLGKRFSRPPRYDRFDTSPYLIPDYSIIPVRECQHQIIKYFHFTKLLNIFILQAQKLMCQMVKKRLQ